MPLRAVAEVNLAAVERNVARLRGALTAPATLAAVVKANAYGHGAVPVAQAALAGGAGSLAVATAEEAAELRRGGLPGPILVMGALTDEELPTALAAQADVVVWDRRFLQRVAELAPEGGPVRVHVKLDTGMGRLGTRRPEEAASIAREILGSPSRLALSGLMTHFATADDDVEFLDEQLRSFEEFIAPLRRSAPGVIAHAANSAATLRVPASHLDMVRCGIAIYGCDPMHEDPAARGLEPALALRTYVAAVKRTRAGESAGYGRRFVAQDETWLATLPVGYGDGVPRRLTNNCDVLIGGRRRPLVGTVSMDNITVDLGPASDPPVRVGEPATLIGSDGDERQTAEELARRLDTINYEVLCAISARVPRRHHHDGRAA